MKGRRKPVLYYVTDRELAAARPCRFCPAQVIFQRTETGRLMVLDVDTKQPADGPGWNIEPHWGRCPGSDQARRTRPIT